MVDTAKTQFLITNHGTHETMRLYRRKRGTVLFKDGVPQCSMSDEAFSALKRDWPEEVQKDKLTLRIVWTLEEIPMEKI